MKRIPKTTYQTADEIDLSIVERQHEVAKLPPGERRQSILKEIAQLRIYADAKRWIESPGLKAGR
jgi:hypothetical protein